MFNIHVLKLLFQKYRKMKQKIKNRSLILVLYIQDLDREQNYEDVRKRRKEVLYGNICYRGYSW